MSITEWHTYFDILTDKYGNPYFTTAEKDLLFNRAQLRLVDEVILTFEEDERVVNKIHTLILRTPSLTMNSSGDILFSAINSGLYKVLSVEDSNNGAISQARHNNFAKNKENSFKAERTRFIQLTDRFKFYPIDTTKSIIFTSVLYPTTVVHPSTSSNLPDLVHNEVVAIALDLAGIATRDEALAQLNQLNK